MRWQVSRIHPRMHWRLGNLPIQTGEFGEQKLPGYFTRNCFWRLDPSIHVGFGWFFPSVLGYHAFVDRPVLRFPAFSWMLACPELFWWSWSAFSDARYQAPRDGHASRQFWWCWIPATWDMGHEAKSSIVALMKCDPKIQQNQVISSYQPISSLIQNCRCDVGNSPTRELTPQGLLERAESQHLLPASSWCGQVPHCFTFFWVMWLCASPGKPEPLRMSQSLLQLKFRQFTSPGWGTSSTCGWDPFCWWSASRSWPKP